MYFLAYQYATAIKIYYNALNTRLIRLTLRKDILYLNYPIWIYDMQLSVLKWLPTVCHLRITSDELAPTHHVKMLVGVTQTFLESIHSEMEANLKSRGGIVIP